MFSYLFFNYRYDAYDPAKMNLHAPLDNIPSARGTSHVNLKRLLASLLSFS